MSEEICDLVGQKFDYWTVISKATKDKSHNKRYLCRCNCGTERIVSFSNLTTGHSRSCGCRPKNISKPRYEDLVGQRFGKLLVIKYDHNQPRKCGKSYYHYWLCKCDCGNEKLVNAKHLKDGQIQSCGCLNKEKYIKNHIQDLTGEVFGKLTVIKLTEKPENTKSNCSYYWLCRCECGNEKIVADYNLKIGNTKSCGCLFNPYKNEIQKGSKFNKLTAIEKTFKDGQTFWVCDCECGNQKLVLPSDLIMGRVLSCGCISKKRLNNLEGKRFGRWTVISQAQKPLHYNKKDRSKFWNCRCDCGNEKVVVGQRLTDGVSTSCGCFRSENQALVNEKTAIKRKGRGLNRSLNFVYDQYRRNAIARKLDFNIDKSEFLELIIQNCHYCGNPPSHRRKTKYHDLVWNGIDRVDNKVGYIKGNMVACCTMCNEAKNDHTLEEFLDWAKNVYLYSIVDKEE